MTFYSKLHERLASWYLHPSLSPRLLLYVTYVVIGNRPAQQFFGDIFTNDLVRTLRLSQLSDCYCNAS